MNESLNYPIKYAVLKVRERLGWGGGYEQVVRGNVVSPCYLIEAKTTYRPDGERIVTYKVVFPYNDFQTYKERLHRGELYLGKPIEPDYSVGGELLNGDIVQHVFDSYEEAEYLAKISNEELEAHLLDEISFLLPEWKIKYENKRKDFFDQLELCQQFGADIKRVIEEEKGLKKVPKIN